MWQLWLNNPRVQNNCLLALVLSIALGLYAPVRNFQFIQLDDPKHITENPSLNPPALAKLPQLWEEPYFGMYIPMTYTVWGLTTIFTNLGVHPATFDPRIYHTLNLLLHTFNVGLLFLILCRLLTATAPTLVNRRLPAPLCAALGATLFAVHPVQVESVAWVSCLKDLLSTSFALLCLWYCLDVFSKERVWRYYVGATACFLLALLSKPSMVILPVFLGLLSVAFYHKPARTSLALFAPWLLAALPIAILTKSAQPSANILFVSPLWMRPLIALDALAFYLSKLVFPFGLSMDYGRTPQSVAGSGWLYVTWILPLGAALIALYGKRHTYALRWGLALAAIALLPMLGFVPFLFQIFSTVADRYLYLPLVGLSLALAWGLYQAGGVRSGAIAGLAIALFGSATHAHLPRWENGIFIFGHSVTVNPDSVLANNNLGVEYQVRSRFREAALSFKKALDLDPKRYDLYSNLGAALVASGDILEGIKQLRVAEENGGNLSIVHYNLGRAYLRLGQFDEARKYAALALRHEPDTRRVQDLYQATHPIN